MRKNDAKDFRDFQKLVEEERKRLAIQKTLEGKSPASRLESLLKFFSSPIVLTVVGFLLTGIIGTWLANHYKDESKKAETKSLAIEKLREFHSAFEKRRTEAVYLSSALAKRDQLSNVNVEQTAYIKKLAESRKATYDESVKDWNIKLLSNFLVLRENFNSKKDLFFEPMIYNDLISTLGVVDKCLEYHFYRSPENRSTLQGITCKITTNFVRPVTKLCKDESAIKQGKVVTDDCFAKEYDDLVRYVGDDKSIENEEIWDSLELLAGARDCGEAITNILYWWTYIGMVDVKKNYDKSYSPDSLPQWLSSQKGARDEIRRQCESALEKARKNANQPLAFRFRW